MVNGPVGAALYEALTKAGAVGFLSISGTPLDEGEDRLPRQYRISRECGGKLPGACIHYLDACEIVEAGADKCRLKVVQKPCVRHSGNVIARIEGTDQALKHQVVTVSAHYDSVPEGPGAYDNMAGCAMVVEACRFFAENPPKRTMEFILFGSEEKGLVGSQAYAAAHAEKIADHVFNLNVEMFWESPPMHPCVRRSQSDWKRQRSLRLSKMKCGPAIPILLPGRACRH